MVQLQNHLKINKFDIEIDDILSILTLEHQSNKVITAVEI